MYDKYLLLVRCFAVRDGGKSRKSSNEQSVTDKKLKDHVTSLESMWYLKSNLKKHAASVHKVKKIFECDICRGAFSRKSSLTTHSATVHEGKKPYECDICSATFSHKSKT